MPASEIVVRKYLEALKESRKGKPANVRDALDIYVGLWSKVIENGTVSEDDEVSRALSKLEEAGGLYKAAED